MKQVNTLIRSMTGFGRSEIVTEERKVTVELKSVNHRYCDMNIKMPKKLFSLEAGIRSCLKKYIERGKVDVYITYEDYGKGAMNVKYNKDIAGEYVRYLREMGEDFNLEGSLNPVAVARFPEVFTLVEESADEEEIWSYIERALDMAGEAFAKAREAEGKNLKKDLLLKLDGMLVSVSEIEKMSPELISEYKCRLTGKIEELLGTTEIDESRIAQEVTIYADKICVDEELVRLRSHIESTKKILTEGGAVGRKLDFIIQEMNREANTILSKSNSLAVSDLGIGLKTDIEKVREQVQNIE